MSKHISISPLFRFPKSIVEQAEISIEAIQINIRQDRRYSFYCPIYEKAMRVNLRLLQRRKIQ